MKKAFNKKNKNVEITLNEDFGDKYVGIDFDTHKKGNWLKLSLLTEDINQFYLEIVNDAYPKKSKNLDNISYYKNELKDKSRTWGKIENVEKGWAYSDWICRYKKLDDYFIESKGWAALADNDFSIVQEIAKDVHIILQVLR